MTWRAQAKSQMMEGREGGSAFGLSSQYLKYLKVPLVSRTVHLFAPSGALFSLPLLITYPPSSPTSSSPPPLMLCSRYAGALRPALKPCYRARGMHSSSSQQVQRLLWAGSVLDRESSSLQEVPKDWLLSLGVQADVEQGISFQHIAASTSHSVLSYVTLPPSLPVSVEDTAERDDFGKTRVNPSGLHKVFAIGRNTFGELGLGFSSQESTWGMVTSGFEGKGGVKAIQCGLGSTWMATAETKEDDCE
jgi:hypothetical protein